MDQYAESKRVGAVSEVTLITPIKPGRIPGEYRTYRRRLENVLDSVQNREEQDIPTPIRVIKTIHYARWVIHEPKGGRPELIFTSNFDGDMKHYFRTFSLTMPDMIDRVWQNCEGYPEDGAKEFEQLWRYVKKYQVTSRAFYSAYRGLTVSQIHLLAALKARYDAMVSELHGDRHHSNDTAMLDALTKMLLEVQGPVRSGPVVAEGD